LFSQLSISSSNTEYFASESSRTLIYFGLDRLVIPSHYPKQTETKRQRPGIELGETMPAFASALARRARHSSVFPFIAWLGIVSISFLIFSTRNNLSTGGRWNVLYTAPHAEFAPFQRVWNPDTNNDYSVQDFSGDEGDDDSGIITDDIAGDDGKFRDVEVPAFNGEDYFDAKPIGCVINTTNCPQNS
jgi:hypothetical protein